MNHRIYIIRPTLNYTSLVTMTDLLELRKNLSYFLNSFRLHLPRHHSTSRKTYLEMIHKRPNPP